MTVLEWRWAAFLRDIDYLDNDETEAYFYGDISN